MVEKNSFLEKKIFEYLKDDCWKKSLMISGKWGIGKTTLIKNFILNYQNILNNNSQELKYTHYCNINGYDIDEKFDIKKYIVRNSYDIKTRNISPLLSNLINKGLEKISNVPKPIKNIVSSIGKNTKINGAGVSISPYNVLNDFYNEHMEYVYANAEISNCIVIIDEIDRKRDKNLKLIFTKIIDILENFNVKLIFIVNKEQLEEEKESLESWYEKIFDFNICIEEFHVKSIIPSDFSHSMKNYISENIKTFSNYRSYNKYLKFVSVIEKKFTSYANNNYIKSIIIRYKECLFYTIFLLDNKSLFEDRNLTKKENYGKTPLLMLSSELVDNFIDLNYDPLFNKLEEEIKKLQFEMLEVYKENEKFLKSCYICHRKDNPNSIDNPAAFLLNVVSKYLSILDVTNVKNQPYNLLYWLHSFSEVSNEFDTKPVFNYIINSIENYWDSIKNEKREVLFHKHKPIFEHMFKTYEESFFGNVNFLNELKKTKLNIYHIAHKKIVDNIKINDDDQILQYSLINNPKTLKIIIESSNDFIDDLRKLKRISELHFNKQKKSYLISYPDEKLRPITDKMINGI